MIRRGLGLFLILIFFLGLNTGVEAYKGINMRTYTRYSDTTTPTSDDVQFIAFYNGDNSIIHTEDSYNNANNNTGWYEALGLTRVQTDQLPSVNGSDTYEIWITGMNKSEAGNATGTVGEINPSYTTPGTSVNKLMLSSSNYLATPSNFSVNPGNGEALIRWNTVGGANGYLIYKRPVPANSNIIFQKVTDINNGLTNYYIETGLSNGTEYNYIIVATANSKISGHPDEITIIPDSSAPNISGPSSGRRGDTVTITGSNFGSTAGSVYFNNVVASSISSWSNTQIVATIANSTPLGAGKLFVIASNNLEGNINFTVDAPDTTKPTSSVTITNSVYGPSTWNQNNTIHGTASDNIGVQYVDITIQRGSDNAYWTGSGWGAQTWLRASGTTSWTYSFAAANMTNGVTYTVQSRATDNSNNVQDPPYGSDSYSWDSQGPTMTFVPANGAINVSPTQNIVVTFSEAMNTGSVSYTLPNATGLSPSWSNGNTVLTVSHDPLSSPATYTFTITAAQDVIGNNYTGSNSTTFDVSGPPQGSMDFTLYQNDLGNINWIAIPFLNTGLIDTVDLGEAIAANFTPGDGDSIGISVWNPQTQTTQQTTGDYAGGQFYWDPPNGQPLTAGTMYKVSIYREGRQPGQTFTVDLTITGEEPTNGAFYFDLYHVDEGNINWISIPRFLNGINTTVDLGNSIASKFSPDEGDSLGIMVWDPVLQTSSQTTGDYALGQFFWDPVAGEAVELGKPYVASIYRVNRQPGQAFAVTWP